MVAATYGFVSAFGQNIALIPTLTTGTQMENACTFNCTMYMHVLLVGRLCYVSAIFRAVVLVTSRNKREKLFTLHYFKLFPVFHL